MKLLILLSLGLVAAVSARSLTENEKREVFRLFSELNKGEDIYKKALGGSMITKREQEAKLVTTKKRRFTHPPTTTSSRPSSSWAPRRTTGAPRRTTGAPRRTTAAPGNKKRELEARLIKKIQLWQGQKRESNGATHWEPEKKEAVKKILSRNETVAKTNVASKVQKRNETEGPRRDRFEDMVMEKLNHINFGVEGLMVAPLMTKIINTLDNLGSVCDHVLMFLHAYLHEVEDDIEVDGSGSGDDSDVNGPSPSPVDDKPPRPSPSAGEGKPPKPAPSAGEGKPPKPAPPAEEKPPKPAPASEEEEEEKPAPEEEAPKPAPASEEEEEEKPAPAGNSTAPASEELQLEEKGNGNSTSNTDWMEAEDADFALGNLFSKRELLKRLLDVLQEKAKSKRSMRNKRNSRSKRNAWWDVDWPLIVDVCHGYYVSHDHMDF